MAAPCQGAACSEGAALASEGGTRGLACLGASSPGGTCQGGEHAEGGIHMACMGQSNRLRTLCRHADRSELQDLMGPV